MNSRSFWLSDTYGDSRPEEEEYYMRRKGHDDGADVTVLIDGLSRQRSVESGRGGSVNNVLLPSYY